MSPIKTLIAHSFFMFLTCSDIAFAQLAPPEKLTADTRAFSDVDYYKVSASGKFVVFASDNLVDKKYDLYSVPITGGSVTQLNLNFATDRKLSNYILNPVDDRLVYSVSVDSGSDIISFTPKIVEINSVALSGGDPVKLNHSLASGSIIRRVLFSADGSRVVYVVRDSDDFLSLFSVASTGGKVVQLNPPPVPGGGKEAFRSSVKISSDSKYVVFLADLEKVGDFDVYSVPIDGGPVVKLSSTDSGTRHGVGSFKISANGQHVVYVLSLSDELYSVPIAGGAPFMMNRKDDSHYGVHNFKISPDSQWVVYTSGNRNELISVPLYSDELSVFKPELVKSGRLYPFDDVFMITADSKNIVYYADQDTNEVMELYSVPIGGASVAKLNPLLVDGLQVCDDYKISPDGAYVVLKMCNTFSGPDRIRGTAPEELYSSPIAGGGATKISGKLLENQKVGRDQFFITPDGESVIYVADQDVKGKFEIFFTPIQGGKQIKINCRNSDLI